MDLTVKIDFNLVGIENYQHKVDSINQRVYIQWAIRYRVFIQRRFVKLSRGGGEWPPLKYRKGSILRNTSTLFNTMAPTIVPPAGSINAFMPGGEGIEVGFAGSAAHPAGPTIPQIAYWHHTGAGHNPVRRIIVPPDTATINAMVRDMERAHAKELE